MAGKAQRALVHIASAVARAEVESLAAEIERSLHRIGLALGADVASIALVDDSDTTLRALYQWRALGWMEPAFELDGERGQWWRERQTRGVEILIDDVRAMPKSADYEQSALITRGTNSLVAVPCMALDRPIAYVVVEHMRKRRYTWTASDLSMLDAYAELVASALERQHNETMMLDAKRRAEDSNRAKTDFIANLSHELRTPLTAILGFAELLAQGMAGPLTDRQRSYLTDIRDSAEHMRAIVNDSLDIARVDARRLALTLREVSLAGVVDGAIAQLRHSAQQRHIELALEADGQRATAVADGHKLRQIVINLVANAIKFTPEGGSVRVRVRTEPEHYEIEVEDTGVGIAARDHERIFETFTRIEPTTGGAVDGCGIGLALVRRLSRAHGGDVTVSSELGHGARFVVRLPRDARAHAQSRPAFVGSLV